MYIFLSFLLSLTGFYAPPTVAAGYPYRGQVLSSQGQPIFGAAVGPVGTNQRVYTDQQGSFYLELPDSCTQLEVFQVAYAPLTSYTCTGNKLQFVLLPPPAPIQDEERNVAPAMREQFLNEVLVYHKAQASGVVASPRVWTPQTENYAHISENRFHRTTQEPLSTFSIDVDAAAYSNVRRFLQEGTLPPADAVRIEEMVNYFPYSFNQPQGQHPFVLQAELGECPWAPQHHLLRLALQAKALPESELPPANLVFLLDVSGSMDQPDKLPLLKASFKLLTARLRPQDRVAIVVYAGAAGVVLAPTPGNAQATMLEALERLQAGGSTAGGAGLRLAYALAKEHFLPHGNNRVILATDGDFNVGVSSEGELVRMIESERSSGIFLTVLGFGTGNYQDDKMQQLADKGNGNHAYIDNLGEARKVLVREFGSTLFTIAKDVKLQLEFNPGKIAGYRLIGYENRLLATEDFKDDAKDAGEMGAGHTVVALYELVPAGVESPLLAPVENLKYQVKTPSAPSRELLTVKMRYKEPQQNQSRVWEETLTQRPLPLASASVDFRWSATVAQFGMLLRDSPFKGNSTYAACKALGQGALSYDPEGYRQEMLRLVDLAAGLAERRSASKD